MSDLDTNVNEAGDESVLDAEIESSIAAVKAGNTIAETQSKPEEIVPAEKGEVAPDGEAKPAGEAPSDPQTTGAEGENEFRLPNKGKFESDEAYEKRVELFDLVKRRKAATTPEAKANLSEDIRKAKGELKTLGGTERFIQPKTEEPAPAGEADPDLTADQERLRQLGGATKEDIDAMLAQRDHDAAVRSDLDKFVNKHSEFKDLDVREVFLDFVDSNYVWQGKSGKELTTTLEMAYENMFRPSESVQDRVLKAAGVQEKVNAMQFPGGTGNSKQGLAPDMRKDIEELTATGMSEEKAIELLSE